MKDEGFRKKARRQFAQCYIPATAAMFGAVLLARAGAAGGVLLALCAAGTGAYLLGYRIVISRREDRDE